MDSIYECGTNIEELKVSGFTNPENMSMEPIDKLKHLKILSVEYFTLNGLKIISNSHLKLEKLDCQLVMHQSDYLEKLSVLAKILSFL